MATKNKGVAISALVSRVQQEIDRQLERSDDPPLSDLGIVDEQSGDSRVLDLTWMRKYSMMNEAIGERTDQENMRLFKSRMYNQTYWNTEPIDIRDIEDDVGMLNPEGIATSLQRGYQDRLEWEEFSYLTHAFDKNFVGGQTTGEFGETIYQGTMDGEPLLSDSHPYFEQIDYDATAPRGKRMTIEAGGEFSNLVNTPLSEDALWNAWESFNKLVDFRGRPANYGEPDTLIIGPNLTRTATQILELSNKVVDSDGGAGAGTVENETQNMVDVYTNNYLTGETTIDIDFGGSTYTDQTIDLDNVWFLVNSDAAVSPFVRWLRKPFELQTPVGTPNLDSDSPAAGEVSEQIFNNDRLKIGGRARFGMSFGMPQVIYGSLGGVTLS